MDDVSCEGKQDIGGVASTIHRILTVLCDQPDSEGHGWREEIEPIAIPGCGRHMPPISLPPSTRTSTAPKSKQYAGDASAYGTDDRLASPLAKSMLYSNGVIATPIHRVNKGVVVARDGRADV